MNSGISLNILRTINYPEFIHLTSLFFVYYKIELGKLLNRYGITKKKINLEKKNIMYINKGIKKIFVNNINSYEL